jgi:PAS domain S-box-containing protein
VRKGGRAFPVEISLAPLTVSGGTYTTAVVRDVSPAHPAARLREAGGAGGGCGAPARVVGAGGRRPTRTAPELPAGDGRFRVAFDRAPIGMALVDARPEHPPVLLRANAALVEMAGIPHAALLARTLPDLIHSADHREVVRPGLLEGWVESAVQAARLVRPDGVERWVSISATVVRDADGLPDYLVTHLVDVTDARRAEAAARERAARDGRIAAVLQSGLLPYVPCQVGPVRAASRYRPAGHGELVGGDWTDVLAVPGGKIGMVVGDVAGHGIESAVTMTRLRTVVRMLATSGVSPAGVMRRLNDVMHETDMGADIDLATLLYAQFDPVTGLLHYCSAGHLPLLLLAPDPAAERRAVSPVPAVGGPPIGVIPGLRYTEQAIHLEPGSTLIGFTDGLIERRGADLDASLLHLLAELGAVPAEATRDVEGLADIVLDLSPGGGVEDDVAVIVLELEAARTVPATPVRRPVDLAELAARPPERWA